MSTPIGNGSAQPDANIDFGWIGQGWGLFRANTGTWIGAVFLYVVAALVLGAAIAVPTGYFAFMQSLFMSARSGAPDPAAFAPGQIVAHSLVFSLVFGAVNAVLMGGLYRMALRQAQGEAVGAGDVFAIGDVLLPLALLGLIVAGLGLVMSLLVPRAAGLVNLLWQGVFMFAPLLIVDRRVDTLQALAGSVRLIGRQWLMAALFFFVLSLASGLGALVCGVGFFVTFPLLPLSLAVGYLAFTRPAVPFVPDYGQAQEGVWPPPPTAPAPPPDTLPPPP